MKHRVLVFSLLAAAVLGLGAWYAITRVEPEPIDSEVSSTPPATATADEDEFVPPTGRAANPPKNSAGERRIMLARSEDGVTFAADGEILSDRANVPDVVVGADGTVRAYYMGQGIEEGKEENTVVALSEDNGTTWTYRKLAFKNFPQPRDPSDPDVVLLDDGTYRMYYTSSIGKGDKLGIVYAESPDGITFTYKGSSFEGPYDAADSTTLYFDGLWHMYVGQEEVQGQLHATSVDGHAFTIAPELRLPTGKYYVTNGIVENGTVRMFGFSFSDKNIRSFLTSDMETWEASGVALGADDAVTLGTGYLQDSSVVKLDDGSYLMVYVAGL